MRTVERGPRPTLARGDEVTVRETAIRPWQGTVLTVKPTANAWWVEVQQEDGGVWVVDSRVVHPGSLA